MTRQFEQRFHSGDVEVREDGDVTRIQGYAAVFNKYSHDLGGFVERIAPGAFTRVLNRGDEVQAWFNHNPDNLLASRTNGSLELSQDERGLRYSIQIDDTDPDHQRVLAKIRRGDLRGSSFGFRVESDDWSTTDQDYPLRTITGVSVLRDVGPVSVPAYPDTTTVGELALRSLAELVDMPVENLVAADDLRDFLLTLGEAETPDTEDAATGETVAASPDQRTRLALPPRIRREWWAEYAKETAHG